MFEQLFKGFIIIVKIWNFHTVCLKPFSTKKLQWNFFSKIYYGSNTRKSAKTVLYARLLIFIIYVLYGLKKGLGFGVLRLFFGQKWEINDFFINLADFFCWNCVWFLKCCYLYLQKTKSVRCHRRSILHIHCTAKPGGGGGQTKPSGF